MSLINLGNVVGLIRGENPPAKAYVLWGKILNVATPEIVQLRYYKGTGNLALEANWLPLVTDKVVKVIPSGTSTYEIAAAEWAGLGGVPVVQLIDAAKGSIINIAPRYLGMVAPNYIPTSIKISFGGNTPNDILLILT